MKLINCGCGEKYNKSDCWINIDFKKRENVIGHNILKGLPFDNNSIDAIFSSCMLEHFTLDQARAHIKECYRILRQDGICRIVVPDLENICREYLNILGKVKEDKKYDKKYEYILIELIDQMTRTYSGGEMLKYWNDPQKDEDYILYRTGYPEKGEEPTFAEKVIWYMNLIGDRIFSKQKWYQERKLGKFMYSGEVHKWMWDSYSLEKLLKEEGFRNIEVMSYNKSHIHNWENWKIEVNQDGSEYKPNSLYMEAVK